MLNSLGSIGSSLSRHYPAPRRIVRPDPEPVDTFPGFQPEDGPISENVRLLIAGIRSWALVEGERP